MAELGFADQKRKCGGDFGSPDSIIFSVESSNFSLFSSNSASVERCSSGSDALDHRAFVSEVSRHLSGHGYKEAARGPDPDPNNFTLHKSRQLCQKVEKAKALKECKEKETETGNQSSDSARSSFSRALKECQDRRSRSEAILKKPDRQRPLSLDLNNHIINITSSSPRFGITMKSSARKTSAFPSPVTPNYHTKGIGGPKGWSSERVPSHANSSRRNADTPLLPYNNGRTLPSKWEDAERWIFSPVTGECTTRPSNPQPQRRPKSKSGPLGPPGTAYYSMYSPAVHTERRNGGSLVAVSPFSAGLKAADCMSIHSHDGYGGLGDFPSLAEPCMARSVSIHGCTEVLGQSSFRGSGDATLDGMIDAATSICRDVSRRDMATQMSPEGSPFTSPRRSLSCSVSNSIIPVADLQSGHSSATEVRDVQVDNQVTMTRWSKKSRALISSRSTEIPGDWKRKGLEVRSIDWDVSETTKSLSKIKRDEAKITAWENLQKAKAEAALRKLEMKLEKKRSSSMDKILNKLRSAQKKAQEMRGSIAASQAHQVARTSQKTLLLSRTSHIGGSLSGCFTCHAF